MGEPGHTWASACREPRGASPLLLCSWPVWSWLLLLGAVVSLGLTINAVRPMRRLWPRVGVGFFPAWLASELALHALLGQAAVVAGLVWLGSLEGWPGQVGAALIGVSWIGMIHLHLSGLGEGRRIRRQLAASLPAPLSELRCPSGRPIDWSLSFRKLVFPFWMGESGVERIADIPYVDDGRSRHRLDIYRPVGIIDRAPVVVQIHGGGWVVGDKAQQGQLLMNQLASDGWICVGINYRLSPRDAWPAHLLDCKHALAWVKERIADYGGDPDFVVVTGGSAGGHLAALLALTPNDPRLQPGFEHVDTGVQGFVLFYGVYDWTNRFKTRGELNPMKTFLERLVVKRPFEEAREIYEDASPMSHVSGDIPPAMILHGTHDNLAPVEDARHFVRMLDDTSKEPVIYLELIGAHHAFEVLASPRAMHAVRGVETFLAWLAAERHRPPSSTA